MDGQTSWTRQLVSRSLLDEVVDYLEVNEGPSGTRRLALKRREGSSQEAAGRTTFARCGTAAARRGCRTAAADLVIEQSQVLGGCLASHSLPRSGSTSDVILMELLAFLDGRSTGGSLR